MKKTLIICLLLSNFCNAQIEVSKPTKTIKIGSIQSATLNEKITGTDTIYVLLFKNAKYPNIEDYSSLAFFPQKNTFNEFYKILKSFFNDENKKNDSYEMNFKLGIDQVTCKAGSSVFGPHYVSIYTDDGYFSMSSSQVDQLFGKK